MNRVNVLLMLLVTSAIDDRVQPWKVVKVVGDERSEFHGS
jgi:hypothetical protein